MSVLAHTEEAKLEALPHYHENEIAEILPHGHDFVWLIDKATIVKRDDGYECQAHVTVTNDHCRGHFKPRLSQILPMVAMMEFVAQAALVLCYFQSHNDIAVFSGEYSGKFTGPAIKPGNNLTIRTWLIKHDRRVLTVEGEVHRQDGSRALTFIFEATRMARRVLARI